jgi:STELLO glycosyltransferases
MPSKTALVVTSISPPNAVLRALAEGSLANGWDFIVAGDTKSPEIFELEGCRFLSIMDQQSGNFEFGKLCPVKSYARKNVAYLDAISRGAEVIVETDDDNFPCEAFWLPRTRQVTCRYVNHDGWVNVYSYFSESFIYPRGLPLDHARDTPPQLGEIRDLDCPLQQGLADANPDVDAVYRMLFPLPFKFNIGVQPIALLNRVWSPFNSQNTTFFQEIFPLLYLPAYCSFRMTDIWRSFVAQRILHHLGYPVLFHEATVWQDRNEHSLHRDFCDEVPGYVNNDEIRNALLALEFTSDLNISRMLEQCYECLMANGWVGREEQALLNAWLFDLNHLGC